jgi:hypothetical protein
VDSRQEAGTYILEGVSYRLEQPDVHAWKVFRGRTLLGEVIENVAAGERSVVEYRARLARNRSPITQVTTDVWGTAVEFLIAPY